MKYLVSDYEVLHRSRIKYSTIFVLPINYLTESSNVYHSDYQFGSLTFIDSPIDYFLGQLCPIFCVCKSTSYDAKCLKTSNLREFPRPPNMNIYNSISAHITAYSNTECITSKTKMYYLSSVYKDADKVFVLKINNLQKLCKMKEFNHKRPIYDSTNMKCL